MAWPVVENNQPLRRNPTLGHANEPGPVAERTPSRLAVINGCYDLQMGVDWTEFGRKVTLRKKEEDEKKRHGDVGKY